MAAALAADLAAELGRGDQPMQLSLSRALMALGDAVLPVLDAAATSPEPRTRAHAAARMQLCEDLDSGCTLSLEVAKRVAAAGDIAKDVSDSSLEPPICPARVVLRLAPA